MKVHYLENSEDISKVLNSKYQLKYDRLFNRKFDSSLVEKILGHKVKYKELEEGLELCLNQFIKENYNFKDIN